MSGPRSGIFPKRRARALTRARLVAEEASRREVPPSGDLAEVAAARLGPEEGLACALALGREASRRGLDLEPFPTQMMAAALLQEGYAVEMLTGEGKTLAIAIATLATALRGDRVHVMTTNAYLARRDREWMAPLFEQLGLRAGVVYPGQPREEKRLAYAAEVTYGSAAELAFDVLRDQLQVSALDQVVSTAGLVIVDEVDAVVIDGAHTPFIIGGGEPHSIPPYSQVIRIVEGLSREKDYRQSSADRSVELTDTGLDVVTRALEALGLLEGVELYEEGGGELLHVVNQCLQAQVALERDRDYLVTAEGRVEIIDLGTGRTILGRRWAAGLHQAVEAKERVKVCPQPQTVARCSIASLLLRYERRAGITGTTGGIERELDDLYGMPVVRLPTHRPVVRVDEPDRLFVSEREKREALLDEIEELRRRGQPVLVGAPTEVAARRLSALLERRGVPHETLTARDHEREAAIVARAGAPGAVTVTTQVAGRGTDIALGDSPRDADALRALGGLRVLALERHQTRRIDDQLRGRSGRQGDPGSTRVYVSLEDELLRRHASARAAAQLERLASRGQLDTKKARRLIDEAQARAESKAAQARAVLRAVEEVLDEQQRAFYRRRRRVLSGAVRSRSPDEDLLRSVGVPVGRILELRRRRGPHAREREWLLRELDEVFAYVVPLPLPTPPHEELEALIVEEVARCLTFRRALLRSVIRSVMRRIAQNAFSRRGEGVPLEHTLEREYRAITGVSAPEMPEGASLKAIVGRLSTPVAVAIAERSRDFGPRRVLSLFKALHLRSMDERWRDHLQSMESLKDSVGLLSFAERAPLQAFRRRAYGLYEATFAAIRRRTLRELLSFREIDRDLLVGLTGATTRLPREDRPPDALFEVGDEIDASVEGALARVRPLQLR
jgi:preprotein translocase subunit SecA